MDYLIGCNQTDLPIILMWLVKCVYKHEINKLEANSQLKLMEVQTTLFY